MRGIQAPSPALVRKAQNEGRVALARVDSLSQTGTRINDEPLCELELTVQPTHGAAYRTLLRTVIPVSQLAAVQPGVRRVVAQLVPGYPDVALLDADPQADIWSRTRIPAVADAGEVQRPVPGGFRDDGKRRKPLIGMGSKGRVGRALLFTVLFLATVAAIIYPHREALAQSMYSVREHGTVHLDMREPYAVHKAIGALQSEIGHDRVIAVRAYKDFVTFEAAVSTEGLRTDNWIYRRGQLENEGPSNIQPEDEREFYAASQINLDRVWAAVRRATSESQFNVRDDTTYFVERDWSPGTADDPFMKSIGDPVARFGFDNGYESVSYTVDAMTGELISVSQ
ncbi:hypothetical protein GCM10027417_11990 [Glutamicibacter endophyticus]